MGPPRVTSSCRCKKAEGVAQQGVNWVVTGPTPLVFV